MTSKHTPGPWEVQKAEDCMGRKLDDLVQWVVTGEDGDLWISTGPTWDDEYSEESRANACLIAASPDLLAALQAMVESAEFNDWDGRSEAQVNARAAIAKATGQ